MIKNLRKSFWGLLTLIGLFVQFNLQAQILGYSTSMQYCMSPGYANINMNNPYTINGFNYGTGALIGPINGSAISLLNSTGGDHVLGVQLNATNTTGGTTLFAVFFKDAAYNTLGEVDFYASNYGTTNATSLLPNQVNGVVYIEVFAMWNSGTVNALNLAYANYTYSWQPSGQTSQNLTNALAGDYTFTATSVGTGTTYVQAINIPLQAVDNDADGYMCDVDCNDNNASIHPDAIDACDNIDNNCNTAIDEDGAGGDPNIYPYQSWNVYAYSGNMDIYTGYYPGGNSLAFNTESDWTTDGSPADAASYQGCPLPVDNHSYSVKREGFVEGDYMIHLNTWDDNLQWYINDVYIDGWGCCSSWYGSQVAGPYHLTDTTKFEFRMYENGGGSFLSFDFFTYIPGCTNSLACNYLPTATVDDNSCTFMPTVNGFNDIISSSNWITAGSPGAFLSLLPDQMQLAGPSDFVANQDYYATATLEFPTDGNWFFYYYFSMANPADASGSLLNIGYVYNGETVNLNPNNDSYDFGESVSLDFTAGSTITFFLYYNATVGAPYIPTFTIYGSNLNRPCVGGCTDAAACNYNVLAYSDDASCTYATAEVCDGADQDCDGVADNGLVFTDYYLDLDGDGYGSIFVQNTCQDLSMSYVTTNTDCNDDDQFVNPGTPEIAGNNVDDDCDPTTTDISVNELTAAILNVYPNPTSNNLFINLSSGFLGNELVVFDALGNVVHKEVVLSSILNLSTSTFANGHYVIKVGSTVTRFTVVH